jgi:hypothetical protein
MPLVGDAAASDSGNVTSVNSDVCGQLVNEHRPCAAEVGTNHATRGHSGPPGALHHTDSNTAASHDDGTSDDTAASHDEGTSDDAAAHADATSDDTASAAAAAASHDDGTSDHNDAAAKASHGDAASARDAEATSRASSNGGTRGISSECNSGSNANSNR